MIGPAIRDATTVRTPFDIRTMRSFAPRGRSSFLRASVPMTSHAAAGSIAEAHSAVLSLGAQGYADQNSVSVTAPITVGPITNDRNLPCDHPSPRPTKFITTYPRATTNIDSETRKNQKGAASAGMHGCPGGARTL